MTETPARPVRARRRATSQTRAPRGGRSAVLAVVLLIVAGVLVALTRSSGRVDEAHGLSTGPLVGHAIAACPTAGAGRTMLGSAPLPGDPGSGGHVSAGPPGSPTTDVGLSRGESVRLTEKSTATRILADGALAAGLFGFRTERTLERPRTRSLIACAPPRADWWFTGAGGTLDHRSRLLLVNVDEGPAVVDLQVLGPHGPVDTVGTRGITLAPGAVKQIPMSDIAPQTGDLALHVHANRGRVVASMRDEFAAHTAGARGREWLPAVSRASRVVRLAGLPARAETRRVLIANPSDLEAIVTVRVSARSGTFSPTGLEHVTVGPGQLRSVSLDPALHGHDPTAVQLTSRVPVTATVRSVSRGGDTSYAAEVLPLSGPAVAPVLGKGHSTVQISGGSGAAASAQVVAYDADGRRVGGTRIDLDPGATRSWTADPKAAYVVVTPEQGRVYGALSYRGDGITQAPLDTLTVRVRQPVVEPAWR
ncbi:MAG TPA: DUF5719 family protein [Nocardioidaceae bacterium]|nr:DUF5719 family protein [Nocardioidaceae bacterium]